MKLTVPPPLLRGWHGSVRQVHLVADMVVGRGQWGTMSCRQRRTVTLSKH